MGRLQRRLDILEEIFFLRLSLLFTCKRRFLAPETQVFEIFENASFSFTFRRTKTKVFHDDGVIHHILMLRKGVSSYFHRFSVFMWAGENDSSEIRVDAFFLLNEEKVSVYVWTHPKPHLNLF